MTIRFVVAGLAAGAIGMSVACDSIGRAASAAGELITVQQAVKQRVGQGTVRIDVTSDPALLRVLVINSPLRGLPADRRKAKARELAAVAYEAHGARTRLARVQIVFQVRATMPLVEYTDGDAHTFDAVDLRGPAPAAPVV